MRARNIKPGFFKNEELAALSLHARLLFIGLWCMADRCGRMEKRPLRIKAEIFPYDSLDINGELTNLERSAFIKTYVVEGKEYLHVCNFLVHQSPHHTEAQSKLPDISNGCVLTDNSPLSLREYPPDSLIPDSLIPDSLIPDSLIPDSLIGVQPVKKKPTKQVAKMSDEDWLSELKKNPAYQGMDFDIEIGKAQAWCMTNNRKCSRQFLVNWFNRAEKKVGIQGIRQTSKVAGGTMERIEALRREKANEVQSY